MKKQNAEKLAIQLTTEILKATKSDSVVYTGQAAHNANHLADFIKTLSNRFQSDLDDNVDLPL